MVDGGSLIEAKIYVSVPGPAFLAFCGNSILSMNSQRHCSGHLLSALSGPLPIHRVPGPAFMTHNGYPSSTV